LQLVERQAFGNVSQQFCSNVPLSEPHSKQPSFLNSTYWVKSSTFIYRISPKAASQPFALLSSKIAIEAMAFMLKSAMSLEAVPKTSIIGK
jgi:hypothetical protein